MFSHISSSSSSTSPLHLAWLASRGRSLKPFSSHYPYPRAKVPIRPNKFVVYTPSYDIHSIANTPAFTLVYNFNIDDWIRFIIFAYTPLAMLGILLLKPALLL